MPASEPVVASQLVTGEWSHLSGTQVLRPNGTARLIPSPVSFGAFEDATVGEVACLVTNGRLEDRQGREGVRVAAFVDGAPVRWRLVIESLVADGSALSAPPVEFDPDPSGVRVTGPKGARRGA